MSSDSHPFELLDLEAEAALFQGKVRGIVAACFENERPLQGLAGRLDWRFQGVISRYLRGGAFTGKLGECVFLPLTKDDRLFQVVLVGAGRAEAPGSRQPLPEAGLIPLRKNLGSLRLERVAVSRADFGGSDDPWFYRALKGASFCLAP